MVCKKYLHGQHRLVSIPQISEWVMAKLYRPIHSIRLAYFHPNRWPCTNRAHTICDRECPRNNRCPSAIAWWNAMTMLQCRPVAIDFVIFPKFATAIVDCSIGRQWPPEGTWFSIRTIWLPASNGPKPIEQNRACMCRFALCIAIWSPQSIWLHGIRDLRQPHHWSISMPRKKWTENNDKIMNAEKRERETMHLQFCTYRKWPKHD